MREDTQTTIPAVAGVVKASMSYGQLAAIENERLDRESPCGIGSRCAQTESCMVLESEREKYAPLCVSLRYYLGIGEYAD